MPLPVPHLCCLLPALPRSRACWCCPACWRRRRPGMRPTLRMHWAWWSRAALWAASCPGRCGLFACVPAAASGCRVEQLALRPWSQVPVLVLQRGCCSCRCCSAAAATMTSCCCPLCNAVIAPSAMQIALVLKIYEDLKPKPLTQVRCLLWPCILWLCASAACLPVAAPCLLRMALWLLPQLSQEEILFILGECASLSPARCPDCRRRRFSGKRGPCWWRWRTLLPWTCGKSAAARQQRRRQRQSSSSKRSRSSRSSRTASGEATGAPSSGSPGVISLRVDQSI